jgi:hypothetical protein
VNKLELYSGIYSPKMEENMPRKSPYPIVLSSAEEVELKKIASKYTSPYYQVVRAKVILMAAQGLDNNIIGQRLDLPRQIVSKWRKRFFEQRLEGLHDRSRPGRPSGFSP